jgi:hypothetical protein
MSSVENHETSNQPRLLQRMSTPVFILVWLVTVPAAAFAALLLGIIICIIAGIEHTDAQTRVCLAALVVGFFGSIYLLARARRPRVSVHQGARSIISAPRSPPTISKPHEETSQHLKPDFQFNPPNRSLTEPQPVVQIEDGPETRRSSASDEAIDNADRSGGPDQFRMIDWLQCWKTPAFFGIASVLIPMMAFQGSPTAMDTAIFGCLLASVPWAIVSQLRGLYFDRGADKLSYPLYFFRRSVRLSEIADANCQTKPGHDDPFSILVGLIGLRATDDPRSKRYIVNLSGDFGARRIVLHSKYKRDQFLSLVRSFAPECRITRWT